MGTALASHLLRSFLDYTRLAGLSAFVLFIDLSKAFDRVIRELAMGCLHGTAESVAESVASLGYSQAFAMNIDRLVREQGSVLEQMGLDGKVREIIISLHSGSWFKVGSSPDLVVARRGGRQGCKLGAIVFNSIYAVALSHVRTSIQKHNSVLIVKGFADGTILGQRWCPRCY